MKNLILSTFLVILSFNVHSFTVVSEKVVDTDAFQTSSIKFKVDKNNLGRAWVEVDLDTDDIDEIWTVTEKVKVEGLRYDQSANKVVLFNGVESVVCADVKLKTSRNIFTRNVKTKYKVSANGNCEVTAELEERELVVDTGFDLQRKTIMVLKVLVNTLK